MARSCSIWTPVLISLSSTPMTGDSAKVSRQRVILATSEVSPQVRTTSRIIDRIRFFSFFCFWRKMCAHQGGMMMMIPRNSAGYHNGGSRINRNIIMNLELD